MRRSRVAGPAKNRIPAGGRWCGSGARASFCASILQLRTLLNDPEERSLGDPERSKGPLLNPNCTGRVGLPRFAGDVVKKLSYNQRTMAFPITRLRRLG